MTRRQDIKTLTEVARRQMADIKAGYRSAFENRRISPEMAVAIKNLCENLRAALDYTGHEVRDRCRISGPKIFYFPISRTRRDFLKKTRKWYPGLEKGFPEVWRALYRVQPFKSRAEVRWLWQFNRLNNENKHSDLSLQTIREASLFDGQKKKLGPIVWIDKSQMTALEFRFKGLRTNALLLLELATVSVPLIVSLVLSELPD